MVDGYPPKKAEEGNDMILKTETLKEKGLSQEQIDFVMAEVGKEINSLTAERDGYKAQLDTAQKSLKEMEGIDAAGLQTKVADLTKQLQGKDSEIEKIKADYAFDATLKEAIRKASGRNEKAIMALLDMEALKASKNQAHDIETALTGLKKDNDYLFQASKPVPRMVSSTEGINPQMEDKKTQANEALRSLFGKE